MWNLKTKINKAVNLSGISQNICRFNKRLFDVVLSHSGSNSAEPSPKFRFANSQRGAHQFDLVSWNLDEKRMY